MENFFPLNIQLSHSLKITEDEDSDREFWNDLEKIPILNSDLSMAFNANKPNEKTLDASRKTLAYGIFEMEWIRKIYEDKLIRVREAKEAEVNSTEIITRNNLKKRYTTTIHDIEAKHRHDLLRLKKDFYFFCDLIKEKDAIIVDLLNLISEIGLHFTESSIIGLQSKKKPHEPNTTAEDIQAFITEIKNQKSQITYLKDICAIYQADTNKANEKAEYFKNEYVKMEKHYKEEIEKIVEMGKARELVFEDEKNQLKNE